MKKGLKAFKPLKTYFSKNQQAVTVVLFVVLFATIGVATLLRSKAAIGNDLIVSSVSMSPTVPAAGQAVTFSAVVRNQGTTAVPAGTTVGVAFYVDNVRVTWNQSNTAGLAAGASVTLTANAGTSGATWTAVNGPHTIRAVADDNNAIPDESNEGNNALSTPITVGSTGNLYISPATNTVDINTNFTVAVRLNPGTTVDAVEATITYDATKVTYISMDATGSPFDLALGPQTGGTGTVKVSRGNLSGGVSADALVSNVTFRAIAGSGSSTLTIAGNATKAGAYTKPTLTNSTVNFRTPDTQAPVVTITAPANNANVFQSQTITANVTDNVGVARAELWIDGQMVGSPDTTAPYSFTIDSKLYSNAAHTVQIRAYDTASPANMGQASVTVNVRNWVEDFWGPNSLPDGTVNLLDFSKLSEQFGQTAPGLVADFWGPSGVPDGTVNLLDFSQLNTKFGQ